MESQEVNKRLRAIYNEVKQIRCNLGNSPSSEADTLLLCDPVSGNLVIAVVTYSVTNVPTATYFNPNGTPYVGPTPVNCAGGQLESDPQEICVNGNTSLIQWVVKDNGQPTGAVYYTDLSGTVVGAPGAGTFTFGACPTVCLPTISDAFADDLSTLLPGTSFVITKPDCCKILVTTSAGTFTLREKETYYATTDFKCPITVTGITIVSGTCSSADIHIISNFNG
ncbi:MAG: hypothetical protein IPJ51_11005 [Saprospiraceae bacterium]|nr:hypothetical protein [Saprospiraceae bacterium]